MANYDRRAPRGGCNLPTPASRPKILGSCSCGRYSTGCLLQNAARGGERYNPPTPIEGPACQPAYVAFLTYILKGMETLKQGAPTAVPTVCGMLTLTSTKTNLDHDPAGRRYGLPSATLRM